MDGLDRAGDVSGPFVGTAFPISTPADATPTGTVVRLPRDLDSETAALLRMVVLPQIEAAESWGDLVLRLRDKGFGLGFRAGRMILSRLESGAEICTGRSLGAPLRGLAARLGRPALRLSRDGQSAQLQG
ncbi:hypothetical protein PVT71_06755 [Salipiger sp. H15]|uniref:Uncharacterized protein n=1 Tax=Alloyangia sp. H15 TaxID=3029062 RepID=A0AAU8AJX0_9RHOB